MTLQSILSTHYLSKHRFTSVLLIWEIHSTISGVLIVSVSCFFFSFLFFFLILFPLVFVFKTSLKPANWLQLLRKMAVRFTWMSLATHFPQSYLQQCCSQHAVGLTQILRARWILSLAHPNWLNRLFCCCCCYIMSIFFITIKAFHVHFTRVNEMHKHRLIFYRGECYTSS